MGSSAGRYNTSDNVTLLGYAAGLYNSASGGIGVGNYALQYNSGTNATAVGYGAAQYNSGTNVTAVGFNAARKNSATLIVAMGSSAASDNTGQELVAVGNNAGVYNSGSYVTALGRYAGQNNAATGAVLVGSSAGRFNSGHGATLIGSNAGQYNTASHVTAVGIDAVSAVSNTFNNVTGLGYNAQPTKSDQVMLGNIHIQEVFSYGAGIFNKYVRPGSATTVGLPAASSAGTGAIMYDTTLGGLVFSNGTAWAAVAGGGGASADRITSGTSAVVVNSTTGIVSISQLGAVASYVHPNLGYVGPGVSATGTVSASKVATNEVLLSNTGGLCSTAADIGRMFRSPTTGRLQVCVDRN